MAYQMIATAVTLNDLEGHSQAQSNLSNICAAFYTVSTDSELARFFFISRASCFWWSGQNMTFLPNMRTVCVPRWVQVRAPLMCCTFICRRVTLVYS